LAELKGHNSVMSETPRPKKELSIKTCSGEEVYYVTAKIQDIPIRMLIDTGSSVTNLRHNIVKNGPVFKQVLKQGV